MGYVQQCSGVVSLTMLAGLAACEAHGVVGSNVSVGGVEETTEGSVSPSSTGGSAPDTTGADTSDIGLESTTGELDDGVDTTDGFIFDVGSGVSPEVCLAPHVSSCDRDSDDPWHALGLNCPGSIPVEVTYLGHPGAMVVHAGTLGSHGNFSAREGEKMVILSTGKATEVPRPPEDLGCSDTQVCPSTALDPFAVHDALPPPIDVAAVDPGSTCAVRPELIGLGDCSNTLEQAWAAGDGAHDYAEIRIKATVPPGANAFAYRFAFFSAEYPQWVIDDVPWNDMYVAWLESEAWTGNISFDPVGNPISTRGVFLELFDANSPLCDANPCVAPELHGFAMQGHAGTRWLETIAPVVEGEDIEIVFALFDLSDALVDTVVLLDDVHWGCTDQPPITITPPAG